MCIMCHTFGNSCFLQYSQLNDVNAVAANGERDLLATGDDFGLVKLFRFPATKRGAKFRKYNGHSAHVTNICWTNNGEYVLTTGGGDHAVFQWKLFLFDFEETLNDNQRHEICASYYQTFNITPSAVKFQR